MVLRQCSSFFVVVLRRFEFLHERWNEAPTTPTTLLLVCSALLRLMLRSSIHSLEKMFVRGNAVTTTKQQSPSRWSTVDEGSGGDFVSKKMNVVVVFFNFKMTGVFSPFKSIVRHLEFLNINTVGRSRIFLGGRENLFCIILEKTASIFIRYDMAICLALSFHVVFPRRFRRFSSRFFLLTIFLTSINGKITIKLKLPKKTNKAETT